MVTEQYSGVVAVRLARLPHKQEVVGSNPTPATPLQEGEFNILSKDAYSKLYSKLYIIGSSPI